MGELALRLVQVAFLALLWGFVLLVVRALRADLAAATRPLPAARPVPAAPAATQAKASRRDRRQERRPRRPPRRLVVVEGSLRGTAVELGDAPVTIGRADGATLVLADDYASGRHARVLPDGGGGYVVEDLGSTNGTLLGRERISGPTPLPAGVPLRIGRTVLELRG